MGQENSLPNGDRDDAKCPACDHAAHLPRVCNTQDGEHEADCWTCLCGMETGWEPDDTRNIITGEEDE